MGDMRKDYLIERGVIFSPTTENTRLFELSPSQAVIPEYISEVFFW